MPLNRLFHQAAAEEEAELDTYYDDVRKAIVEKRQELEVYETDAWRRVDELLAAKLEDSFRAMMVGEPDQMILARERARVVSDLRSAPTLIREKIAELEQELHQLEGE